MRVPVRRDLWILKQGIHGINNLTKPGLSQIINPMNPLLQDPQITPYWNTQSEGAIMKITEEITQQSLMGGYLNAFQLYTAVALAAVLLSFIYRSNNIIK